MCAILIATWDKWPLLIQLQMQDIETLVLEEESLPATPPLTLEAEKGPVDFVLDLQNGESLYAVLRRKNIPSAKIIKVVAALQPHFNPRYIRPNHDLHMTTQVAKDGVQELLSLTLRPNITTEIHIKAHGDKFVAVKKKLTLVEKKQVIKGAVDFSLYVDAKAKKIPDAIIGQMIRGFSYDVDFQRSIVPGTQFGVYYSNFVNEKTEQKEAGDLHYAFLIIGNKKHEIYRFVHTDGSIGFYDNKAESIRKTLLKTPVDGARINSRFGMRHHPVLGYSKMHKGVDFAAPTGTPIMAAGDGKIIKAARLSSYGNYIRIQHNTTYDTAYAHLSRYGPGVKVGKWIKQGQVIGYVGATGRCTGAHLHYEVLKKGIQVNPANITQLSSTKLSGADYKKFLLMKKEITHIF